MTEFLNSKANGGQGDRPHCGPMIFKTVKLNGIGDVITMTKQ